MEAVLGKPRAADRYLVVGLLQEHNHLIDGSIGSYSRDRPRNVLFLVSSKDPYDVLGVPRNADLNEIKKAYRKLAARFHPDKKDGDPERFKEVTAAFDILKDTFDAPPTINEPEFIEEDLTASLELTLEEMVFGCSKKVEVKIGSIKCKGCSGAGSAPGSPLMPCISCLGTGKVQGIWGFYNSNRTCSTCKGSGMVPAQVCRICGGKGKTKGKTEVSVNIPAGVEPGQEVGFAGEIGTGVLGRLFVTIVGIPHPKFERCGDDLIATFKLGVLDAMTGCNVSMISLDGRDVDVEIPSGTQPGEHVILTGSGVKNAQTGRIGDLRIVVQVEIPKKLSPRSMRLVEELSHEPEFKKRL